MDLLFDSRWHADQFSAWYPSLFRTCSRSRGTPWYRCPGSSCGRSSSVSRIRGVTAGSGHRPDRTPIVAYRERYETIGILENSPYPDVHDTLTTLRFRGHQMKVVTG